MNEIELWRGSEVKRYEIRPETKELMDKGNILYHLLRFDPPSFYLLLSMVSGNRKPFYTEPELRERMKNEGRLDSKVDNIQKEVSKSLETLEDIGLTGSKWESIEGLERKVYFLIEK